MLGIWKGLRCCSFVLLAIVYTASGAAPKAGDNSVVEATLNGLSIVLDASTGSILHLAYPGPGDLLDATPSDASIVDVAYPIEDFEPLRLASRYSRDARIAKTDRSLTVAWEKLGVSRPFSLEGNVSAKVHFEASEDGRSVILTCEIENRSAIPVKQVLFPDLAGLIPFAGEEGTEFRGAGLSMKPFEELRTSDRDRFYATNASFKVLKTGDLNDTKMIVRWMDLGSLQGGFSLFPKRWGWDPRTRILLSLSDRTGRLRLMSEHSVEIEPGGKWSSGEFLLTPHKNGWAKGIEPYREWARGNIQREYPVPKHVRDGFGFRSLWMCQNQPNDPQDAVWKFGDLVPLAQEAKEHGLDEIVMWIWHKPFTLPFPPPYEHLGTESELIEAVRQCKEIGVNLVPFVSVLQAEKKTAERYGLTVTPGSGNWTYHTELIPRFNPSYASNYTCAQVDTTDAQWQEDVFASCERLIRSGIPSLCWDQYWSVPEKPNLNTLTSKIRVLAKQVDPESTFSGEELKNFEVDCDYLDYTWNWGLHENLQPLVSVFPAPRINVNINNSPAEVKRCFADNLYANVWPLKPDSPNGSDWISNHRELSLALKQCVKLRAQFLPFFTDGTFIGDCILADPCPQTRVSAYVLPDKAIVILINEGDEDRTISAELDLQAWLPSDSGKYTLKSYDSDGALFSTESLPEGRGKVETRSMRRSEMIVLELNPA